MVRPKGDGRTIAPPEYATKSHKDVINRKSGLILGHPVFFDVGLMHFCRAMLCITAAIAGTRCLSVCPSVCPSVCLSVELHQNE